MCVDLLVMVIDWYLFVVDCMFDGIVVGLCKVFVLGMILDCGKVGSVWLVV